AVSVQVVVAQDPNISRGVSAAGRLYTVHDIDTISQFNGHLTVRIPIGQSFPVGPLMTAQLVLTNNSSVWDYDFVQWQNPGEPSASRKHHAIPETYSNAGLGWLLSMGQLVPPDQYNVHGWFYRAPDGSQHDVNGALAVSYTSDGSFLRLKRIPSNTT